MSAFLDQLGELRWDWSATLPRLFPAPDPRAAEALRALYAKYRDELRALSIPLAKRRREMQARGQGTTFGDVEGELLYMLIREARPTLAYEISPDCGYSTNYMLAALTTNGHGRLVSFELSATKPGGRTEDVIRANLLEGSDGDRLELVLGDARRSVPARLALERPDLLLIDSCHDDFFAEFYVKMVLPHVEGTVMIQDVAFGSSPEPSSEADYVLSFLQQTATPYFHLAAYEQGLRGSSEREGLAPRRPLWSNSIAFRARASARARADATRSLFSDVLAAEERGSPPPSEAVTVFPVHSRRLGAPSTAGPAHPEDAYDTLAEPRPIADKPAEGFVAWSAVRLGGLARASVIAADERESLLRDMGRHDPWTRVRIGELLGARLGVEGRIALLATAEATQDAEIAFRLARIAADAGDAEASREWLSRASTAASDPAHSTGYRVLLRCAEIHLRAGRSGLAREDVRRAIRQPSELTLAKASVPIAEFVIRQPSLYPVIPDMTRLPKGTIGTAVRQLARRARAAATKRRGGART